MTFGGINMLKIFFTLSSFRNTITSLFVLILVSACSDFDKGYYFDKEVVKEFTALREVITHYNLEHFGIYGKDIITINDLIINLKDKTYGVTPKGGAGKAYFERSKDNHYNSWSELGTSLGIKGMIPKSKILSIIKKMESLSVSEYSHNKEYDVHIFQNGNSVIQGFYGVMSGADNAVKSLAFRNGYDVFEKIEGEWFYFELR